MTPSELKYKVEQAGNEPHFFDRKTMRFWGDTMANYAVVSSLVLTHFDDAGIYHEKGVYLHVWELYRKHPVKHGQHGSAYFSKETFRRVHEMHPWEKN